MLKNIKIFTIIFLISSIVWITIDFFFGRNLLNKIKFYNNHGTVHPNFHHTFLPNINKILSWSNKDYAFCTDNNGFRISCDSKNTKEKFFDIAFIGDSVTEGVGLNFEDTIVGIFNNQLKYKKIANLAASSYSTHIYNNKIKYYIENKYIFNEVIVLIDPSDIQDDTEIYKKSNGNIISKNREINNYNFYIDKGKYLVKKTIPMSYELIILIKKKFKTLELNLNNQNKNLKNNLNDLKIGEKNELNYNLNDGKKILKKNINNLGNEGRNTLKKKLTKYEEEFSYIDLRRLAWTYDEDISYGNLPISDSIKIATIQMEELYKFLNSKNISLSIVVYPSPAQLAFDEEISKQVKIWKKFCHSRCKQFVNTFPYFFEKMNETSFEQVNDEYYIKNDVHFNKKGNLAIANLIISQLKK